MRRWLRALAAAAVAVALLAATAVASLIGLSAECTGSTADCPRSDAYLGTLLAIPVAGAVLLVAGTAWSVRRRTVQPLVLAEAGVLAVDALVDAGFNGPDIGTVVPLAVAVVVGRSVLRRPTQLP